MIDGINYKDLKNPISKLGALIDENAAKSKLTAKQHFAGNIFLKNTVNESVTAEINVVY